MSRPPATLLIVEDEAIVALDLQHTLEDLGYRVSGTVASASEAIEAATRHCPDLVLMDIRIQGPHDGVTTASLLRDGFGVPVVFLTAHSDATTLARASQARGHGYLVKPVSTDALRSTIEMALFAAHVEREREARDAWLAGTVDRVDDAILSLDRDGRVTYLNAAAAGLGALPLNEAIGRPLHEVLPFLPPSEGSSPDTSVQRTHHIMVHGAPRVLRQATAPLRAQGASIGSTLVLHDLTPPAVSHRAELIKVSMGIAHEVNNPLTAVLANARLGLLQLDELHRAASGVPGATAATEELRACLDDILHGAQRIQEVVVELSDYSGTPTASAVTDADTALNTAIETMRERILERATLHVDLHAGVQVPLRQDRLERVVLHLLENALAACNPTEDSHRIVVSAECEGPWVRIEVRDDGVGMTEAVRQRAFEPFYTTRPHGSGRGMGLAVVQGLVQAAGGRVELESQPGHGTTATVQLPSNAAATEPVRSLPAQRPRRVLIVEDAPLLRRAIARILGDVERVEVESGAQLLEELDRGGAFDGLLLDLHVNDMPIERLYEALLDRTPQLTKQAVLFTSGAMSDGLRRFARAVPNPLLAAPLDPVELREALGLDQPSDPQP